MNSRRYTIFAVFVAVFVATSSAAPVELQLRDGQRIPADTASISSEGVWVVREGQRIHIPRRDIVMFRFPATPAPGLKTPLPSSGLPSTPAGLPSTQVTSTNLAGQLNTPAARAQFATIRSQFLGNQPAAQAKANTIYEDLASGRMSLDQLLAQAQALLGTVDGYKEERGQAPQFEPQIAMLRQILQDK